MKTIIRIIWHFSELSYLLVGTFWPYRTLASSLVSTHQLSYPHVYGEGGQVEPERSKIETVVQSTHALKKTRILT